MPTPVRSILDCPIDEVPDSSELIEAAMQWHFDPRTGSPFWLRRAETLDFNPRRDVHTYSDLGLFPNVVEELRTVPIVDLVPRGCAGEQVFGVYETGGTTGSPKRVVILNDWMDRIMSWYLRDLEALGLPPGTNWLAMVPSGPHMFADFATEWAQRRGGYRFAIDIDPRWVKVCLREGHVDEADRYAEHLVDQTASILQTQQVGVLLATPPLLARLARRDDLIELINATVNLIVWGGAHMDPDTHHLLDTEIFPDIPLYGHYGSVMILGSSTQRLGPSTDGRCVFDPFSPYMSFSVVDPDTGEAVPYGERGRVVMHHLSRNMLLPNNLERDLATRMPPPPGLLGDSVADVTSVDVFDGGAVVEGVY